MMETVRRVVLLGPTCSGKSTVGAALARRLEWAFVDLDAEIEHHTGQAVKTLVAREGEPALRALEAELSRELSGTDELVLAPGGGWITQPELLAGLGAGTLSVWLQASADELLRRLADDPLERPLRAHPDPGAAFDRLLAEREPCYRLADLAITTDGRSPESIAFEIECFVRGVG
jgi:shikimate kinase